MQHRWNEDWNPYLEKAEKNINHIKEGRAKYTFCDKYGNELKVGDKTNRGIIIKIKDKDYALTNRGTWQWSMMRKV